MSGKKYKVLTLETKIKLLQDVDTKAMTLTEIGEKCRVHKSTISKIQSTTDKSISEGD